MTGRGATDQGKPAVERGDGHRAFSKTRAEQPQPAGVRVDDRNADRRARYQAEFPSRPDRKPMADLPSHRPDLAADTPEVRGRQIAQTDLPEKTLLPACPVKAALALIGPLADRGA